MIGIGNVDLKTYKLKEDEYIKDNMLYCKKCFGERLFISPDKKWIKIALCNCQSKARDEAYKEEQRIKKLARFEKLKEISLLAERYKNSYFDNLDTDRPKDFLFALKKAKSFVESWEKLKNISCGMYIYGDTGTGKTELTACIGNELLKKQVPVLFTSFIEIQKKLRAGFNTEFNEDRYINQLTSVDLLILDDLGAENLKRTENSWLQEKIYDIINLRYNKNKPTIFSSNLSLAELQENGYEKRTLERIAEISTHKIEIRGESYRKNIKNIDLF